MLQENDFQQWGNLRESFISPDGNWISYQINYIERADTLEIKQTKTNTTFKIERGEDGVFIPGMKTRWFVFKKENEGVGLMDLENGNIKWMKNVDYFEVSMSGELLLGIKNNTNNTKDITLLQPATKKEDILKGITDYSLSPNGSKLAYTFNKSGMSMISVRDVKNILYSKRSEYGKHFYHTVVWKPQGDAVAFLNRSTNPNTKAELENILEWNLKLGSINTLNATEKVELMENEIVSNLLYYSDDGSKLIFNITPISNGNKTGEFQVQEWKASDPWIYPQVQSYWKWENQMWKTVWWPRKNKLVRLGNAQMPQVMISPQQQYAIIYSQIQYEPQFCPNPYSDFYIVDLNTGIKKLIVKNMEVAENYFRMSPEGKYISYFKNKEWWIYDVKLDSNKCITNPEISTFYSNTAQNTVSSEPFGNPGWISGDNKILLYDEYDIWGISPDGFTVECLTNGAEEKISFRIDNYISGRYPLTRSNFQSQSYNLEKDPLILIAKKLEIPFAYYSIDGKGRTKLIVEGSGKITNFRKANHFNSYVFTEESAEQSPSLFYLDSTDGLPVKLYQSNPQQSKYLWGKTELYEFQGKEGIDINAVLHYPDNYEKGNKYPMVVHVYEKMSNFFHDYKIPTFYGQDGFNSRLYTANGYFVLEPDIEYTVGYPGFSALDCVTAAVKETLKKEIIDKERIGLIGHSFGGYETAFIIGQTDIFKTAVAGAPTTDFTSSYFSISQNYSVPDMWRYENQQFRMGVSYFEDKEAYLQNSPLFHADKINCPLLLWTGDNDGVVSYKQSIALYLALRRQGKTSTLLVYPNENHVLLKKENQYDLSTRIKNWFDMYLK